MHGLHQLMSNPTHISLNSLSCIDQTNLAVNCGVQPSLHPNCHHQIIYCKLNLMSEYTHQSERLFRKSEHVNKNRITRALHQEY